MRLYLHRLQGDLKSSVVVSDEKRREKRMPLGFVSKKMHANFSSSSRPNRHGAWKGGVSD